ncbi:Na+/H+ antiporter NhaC [Streptomyces jeddahensis]|uniref:Malate-2H(+)/Na(+)-lactate antiporter n=1 Tax=Streptomyces jeddahensis TaxID=1716141 RepID=A0A177HTA3_9ACTN|nr:Na+/H+ antiporter NhaC [Streptomyces jeddahensis]OAH13819.1 malate-2H(+)/Na(+)-lactate antiporter [Streptomyces jeddahensis]
MSEMPVVDVAQASPRRRPRRTPTLFEAALPIVLMLALVIPGSIWLRLNPVVLLIAAGSCAGIIAWRLGVTWEEMLRGIREKIDSAMPALLILVAIGMLIGTWTLCGTIPMIVDFGLRVIEPSWIVLVAFLITMVVSTMTGTSWGSAGTVGVALMGVAAGLGASLPMTAGAVVSGAYFGDKMSPLSDTTNLAPAVAGSTLFEHIRHLFYTTLPAAGVSAVLYFVLGLTQDIDAHAAARSDTLVTALDHAFDFNVLLLLPPVVVLAGAMMKQPPVPTIVLSSMIAAVLGMAVQGFTIHDISDAAATGFDVTMLAGHGVDPSQLPAAAETLLNRGGMASMAQTILIGLVGFALAGILTEAGCMDVLMHRLLRRVRRTGGIILATAISSLGTAMAMGVSYLAILIPGQAFKNVYRERGLAAKNLSRTLEDSGTVFVPLVPWTEAGMYMATTLGVATIAYAPYAFLNYLGAVFAIICGFTGFGIARIKTPDNAAKQPSKAVV